MLKHDLREQGGLIVGLVTAIHHYKNPSRRCPRFAVLARRQLAFTSKLNRRDSTVPTHETSRRSRELSPCPKMSRNGHIWPRESAWSSVQSLLNFHTGGPTTSTPILLMIGPTSNPTRTAYKVQSTTLLKKLVGTKVYSIGDGEFSIGSTLIICEAVFNNVLSAEGRDHCRARARGIYCPHNLKNINNVGMIHKDEDLHTALCACV